MTKARTLADNFAADINGITAGTGITGGGTSGTVTVTNEMATIIDAKGDLVGGTGADTVARLGVGANGTVLTADSVETTGLKWATPTGGSSGPAFNAYRATSTQTVTSGAYTKIQFNAETFDTDNCFDSTTNFRFTPNKAGYYQMNTSLNPYFSTANFGVLRPYFNGAGVRTYTTDAGYGQSQGMPMSWLIYFNGTTDYMEVYLYVESNADVGYAATLLNNTFSGVWIRS
jgi:hypothetical protein